MYFSCQSAAGQVIDKKDGIVTAGFYIHLGTAQVLTPFYIFDILTDLSTERPKVCCCY